MRSYDEIAQDLNRVFDGQVKDHLSLNDVVGALQDFDDNLHTDQDCGCGCGEGCPDYGTATMYEIASQWLY